MKTVYKIREHERLPGVLCLDRSQWNMGKSLTPQSNGLDRWFFKWQYDSYWNSGNEQEIEEGYYASYVIGAQWFDEQNALVIDTKKGCDSIDFMKMFNVCYESGITPDEFAKIYEIDFKGPVIYTSTFQSVVSPLMVVHFLMKLDRVIRKGLRKDYVIRSGNLNKVKGSILIYRNERENVISRRLDRVCCRYQEYSMDTLENRLLKKALLFSLRIIDNQALSNSVASFKSLIRTELAAFSSVGNDLNVSELKCIKRNKLYKEYDETVRLALQIIRKYDYSITNVDCKESNILPFWIDMSLLYEHYILGLLKAAYGDAIHYQTKGNRGEKPDFLFIQKNMKYILDTKYIPKITSDGGIQTYIFRQLSGYARNEGILKQLGYESDNKGRVICNEVIPCVLVYPEPGVNDEIVNVFKGRLLEDLLVSVSGYCKFYKICVPLPILFQW